MRLLIYAFVHSLGRWFSVIFIDKSVHTKMLRIMIWQRKWNKWGFRPPLCTLLSQENILRIRNSSPGDMRQSTQPLVHGGSLQYWIWQNDVLERDKATKYALVTQCTGTWQSYEIRCGNTVYWNVTKQENTLWQHDKLERDKATK